MSVIEMICAQNQLINARDLINTVKLRIDERDILNELLTAAINRYDSDINGSRLNEAV